MILYLKYISSLQEEIFNSGDVFYMIYMFFMMGIFLAFPIVTSSYFKKSNYIKQQIISSKVSKKSTLLNDTLISSTINFIMFSIVTIFTIIIVSSLFGNSGMCLNKDSFSVEKFIYHQFTLLLLIITLSIQAICIQKIVENQFLSSGIFLLLTYVIPLILMQLRFFSDMISLFSKAFPMCQIAFLFRGDTNIIQYFIVIILNIIIALGLSNVVIERKEL